MKLSAIAESDNFLLHGMFGGAAFHISGHANSHSCRIWGQKWSHAIYEHVGESLGFNVCFGIMYGEQHKHHVRHLPGKFTVFHKLMTLNKKKTKFCFNKTVLHRSFHHEVGRALNFWFSSRRIGSSRPKAWYKEFQTSHHCIFLDMETIRHIFVICERELTEV